MSDMITLISNDSQEFKVKRSAMSQSSLITDMLSEYDDDGDSVIIPVDISGAVLSKVLDFCNYSNDNLGDSQDLTAKLDVKPAVSQNMYENVPKWYADYVNIVEEPKEEETPYNAAELEFLIKIMSAANYLDIQDLINLTCVKFATFMKNRIPSNIAKKFNSH